MTKEDKVFVGSVSCLGSPCLDFAWASSLWLGLAGGTIELEGLR